MIRLRLTSSARCAVFALSLTPRVSILDGVFIFTLFRSNEFTCDFPGFVVNLPALNDGDGFRTIAVTPTGTNACFSVNSIGSLTCNSVDCCTIIFGRLWDRFKCWFYISTWKKKYAEITPKKKWNIK